LNQNEPDGSRGRKDREIPGANKSPALKKYLKLSQQSLAASAAATKKDDALKIGPHTFFGGVETDLAELCIGAKQ